MRVILSLVFLAAFLSPLQADVVLVDFGNTNSTEATGSDVYNLFLAGGTGGDSSDLATNGTGNVGDGVIDGTNLTTSTGEDSTIGLAVTAFNNGAGQLRSNNSGTPALSPGPGVAGFEDFASADSVFLNNHNTNGTGEGNEFGLIFNFSGLDDTLSYDIDLLVGTSNNDGNYAVTTGVGGPTDPLTYTEAGTLTFSGLTSVGGVIELTNTVVPTANNFQNTAIAAVSIADVAAVPEPSSLALLGLAGTMLVIRRRR